MFVLAPVLGTGLSTLVALLALAASNGTSASVINSIAGVDSDILITAPGKNGHLCGAGNLIALLEQRAPHVRAIAPYVIVPQLQVGDDDGGEQPPFVIAKGISSRQEAATTQLGKQTTAGQLAKLDDPGIPMLLGEEFTVRRKVNVGDQVVLTVKDPISDRRYLGTIVGTYKGEAGSESRLAYTSLAGARRIQGLAEDCVTGVAVKTDDSLAAPTYADRYRALLGDGFVVRDWTHTFKGYWSSLALLRRLVFFLDAIILAVGLAFSLSSVLLVMHEKRRDAAILSTLGMSSRGVRAIFVSIALMLVAAGIVGAVLLAVPMTYFLNRYHVIRLTNLSAVVSFVSFDIRPVQTALVCALELAGATVYSWWLSADVSRLPVAEILRDE